MRLLVPTDRQQNDRREQGHDKRYQIQLADEATTLEHSETWSLWST